MQRLLIIVFMTFLSCTGQSQSINQEISTEGQKPHLLGEINKEGLTSENYNLWFSNQYNDYTPKAELINKISKELNQYKILAFMGTWCGDSRREVPRFYKVLEAAKYPMSQLKVIAVSNKPNMYKQSPNHEERGLNIHRVPIFIFYKNGKEINRIVERPVVSLEDDISNIMNNKYTSNYSALNTIDQFIDEKDFYEKAYNQIEKYKKQVKNMYELNTYSKILMTTNRQEKAVEVLRLNTKLFPENPKTYISLAKSYNKLNQKDKALLNYKKAHEINPENNIVKNKIDQLKSEVASSNN